MQSALHRFTKLHLDLLESIVREGAEPGQFQIQDQRPRDVAMQILAGAQGALMIRRLTGDAHVIDAVTAEFRSYSGLRSHEVATMSSISIGDSEALLN